MKPDVAKRTMALAAVGGAIPLTHMLTLGYNVFSFEMLFALVAFAGIGAALALITARTVFYGPLLVLTVYWFLDVYFIKYPSITLVVVLLGALIASMELRRIEQWALPMLSVFAVVFTVISMLKPGQELITQAKAQAPAKAHKAPTAANGDRPKRALLHIVIDEQMSPLAVPESMPEGHPAQTMMEEYRKRGFTFHASAEANSKNTYRSLGGIMGLTKEVTNYKRNFVGADFSYEVKESRYLKSLKQAGYSTSVLQTSFLDLCRGETTARCETYSRANNMSMFERIKYLQPTYAQRVQILFRALYGDFTRKDTLPAVFLIQLADDYVRENKLVTTDRHGFFSRPLIVLKMFDKLMDDVDVMQPGDAQMAHLLLPHFPYVLRADCTFKNIDNWQNPARYSSNTTLEPAYKAFWDQAACTHDRLMALVDKAIAKGFVDIIIHGDHGARISQKFSLENHRDINMTIHAARIGEAPVGRVVREDVSLQGTFIETVEKLTTQ